MNVNLNQIPKLHAHAKEGKKKKNLNGYINFNEEFSRIKENLGEIRDTNTFQRPFWVFFFLVRVAINQKLYTKCIS